MKYLKCYVLLVIKQPDTKGFVSNSHCVKITAKYKQNEKKNPQQNPQQKKPKYKTQADPTGLRAV